MKVGSNYNIFIECFFSFFFWRVRCGIMEWGFCFGVREALAMSWFFLGGEMGLWVVFRIRLWARSENTIVNI